MAGLRFCLLVAFLVIFIGWGLETDAKPIDKPAEKDEKETTEATEVTKDEDEGDDDADAATRSKVQKHKKESNDCKREFHVQGACHPFHDHPEIGGNDYDDDDARTHGRDEDRPEGRRLSSEKEESKNMPETKDEASIEQDILNAEEGRDSTATAAPDAAPNAAPDAAAEAVAPNDQDVHTEGEQREINGGHYDHHSSNCPCMHDLICQTGHHNTHLGHGLGGHGGLGLGGHGGLGGLGYGGHGCGCGCTHGALGPSGACIPMGTCAAGHLGTFVCNATQSCCSPNFHCSNICGNIGMGLPHPECQLCSSQDKNNVECEKCYHPCCNLVNINGNVGLSLPHPCIQLDANQTCNQQMLTHGSCCNNGHFGCAYGNGFGHGSCCHGGNHCCGCGRDDISPNENAVLASGDGPADDTAQGDATDAAAPGDVKSPTKRSADEEDVTTRNSILGGCCEHSEPHNDCCHHGNELQIANHCPDIGSSCHEDGHIHNVLPHPGSQLDYHHGVYDNECEAGGCGHVHNPLPHTCTQCCHDDHGGHGCHHHCCHHNHHCGHHCCHCGHHGHHGCCHDCCHHGHHGHGCCHHDCCHHDYCPHGCCHHDCCCCGGHHKRTVVPLDVKNTSNDEVSSSIVENEGNILVNV